MQTDDAGVLDRGACEVEAFAARVSIASAAARKQNLQLGCGLGLSTQLALGTGAERVESDRMQSLSLAGKTELWQGPAAAGASHMLTFSYAVGWARSSGQTWRHASSDLKLIYSAPLASEFTVHANVGSGRDEQTRRRNTSWGLAVEHGGWGTVSLMTEVFGDDREPPWWNVGLRWAVLPDRWFADFSYGRQVAGGRPRLLTLGSKLVF
ncbi:MAG TPA: hypothetical protein VEZ89_00405 [Rubrivivax sp.]|nr:hypothetical protein [Rubrivivax sp.]